MVPAGLTTMVCKPKKLGPLPIPKAGDEITRCDPVVKATSVIAEGHVYLLHKCLLHPLEGWLGRHLYTIYTSLLMMKFERWYRLGH